LFTLIFTLPIAARLTDLAGSPPVNSANTDAIYSLIGLLVGLAFGAMLALGPASRNSGPRRGSPPRSGPADAYLLRDEIASVGPDAHG
jgi:hypothetical protein